ncbi:MAG: hypothetical protein ACRD2S_00020, partial [Terriglobales bacterium]
QVRPFLYRPLLPFKKFDVTGIREGFGRIGVFQAAVEDGQFSNSHLNPVLFQRPQDYEVSKLRDNVRGTLKKAFRNSVSVRRMIDEEQFSERAYPVYLSFYERTKYGFDTKRKERTKFATWAHALFQFPEAVILGALVGHEFVSFEITCLVENTLIIKTIVTSGRALELGTPDLLLHCYRTVARDQPEVRTIYDGMLSQNRGLNNYKIMRGARVTALPAFLRIPASVLWMIRKASGCAHEKLLGLNSQQLGARGFERPFTAERLADGAARLPSVPTPAVEN